MLYRDILIVTHSGKKLIAMEYAAMQCRSNEFILAPVIQWNVDNILRLLWKTFGRLLVDSERELSQR